MQPHYSSWGFVGDCFLSIWASISNDPFPPSDADLKSWVYALKLLGDIFWFKRPASSHVSLLCKCYSKNDQLNLRMRGLCYGFFMVILTGLPCVSCRAGYRRKHLLLFTKWDDMRRHGTEPASWGSAQFQWSTQTLNDSNGTIGMVNMLSWPCLSLLLCVHV